MDGYFFKQICKYKMHYLRVTLNNHTGQVDCPGAKFYSVYYYSTSLCRFYAMFI